MKASRCMEGTKKLSTHTDISAKHPVRFVNTVRRGEAIRQGTNCSRELTERNMVSENEYVQRQITAYY